MLDSRSSFENFTQTQLDESQRRENSSQEVGIEQYTPSNLRYIRTLHTTYRALFAGTLAMLPDEYIGRFRADSFVARMQYMPLHELLENHVDTYQSHQSEEIFSKPDSIRRSPGSIVYDINIFKKARIIDESVGEDFTHIKMTSDSRPIVAASSGYLLSFALKYPHIPLELIFKKGDSDLENEDGTLSRSLLLKFLVSSYEEGYIKPLFPYTIANAISKNHYSLRAIIADMAKLHILNYQTEKLQFKINPFSTQSIDTIPRIKPDTKKLLYILKEVENAKKDTFISLDQLGKKLNLPTPLDHKTQERLKFTLRNLMEKGYISIRNQHEVTLTEEQYSILKEFVYIIDNTISPSETFIQKGQEHLYTILNTPSQVKTLYELSEESSNIRNKIKRKEVFDNVLLQFLLLTSHLYSDEDILSNVKQLLEEKYHYIFTSRYIRENYFQLKENVQKAMQEGGAIAQKVRYMRGLCMQIEEIFKGASALILFDTPDKGDTVKEAQIIATANEEKSGFENLLKKLSQNPKIDAGRIQRIVEELDTIQRVISLKAFTQGVRTRIMVFIAGKRLLGKNAQVKTDVLYFPLLLELAQQAVAQAYKRIGVELHINPGDIVQKIMEKVSIDLAPGDSSTKRRVDKKV